MDDRTFQIIIAVLSVGAVILGVFLTDYINKQNEENQKNIEIANTKLMIALETHQMLVAPESFGQLASGYTHARHLYISNNGSCYIKEFSIYPPNGVYYSFQSKITEFDPPLAENVTLFYLYLVDGEQSREAYISSESRDSPHYTDTQYKYFTCSRMYTDLVMANKLYNAIQPSLPDVSNDLVVGNQ